MSMNLEEVCKLLGGTFRDLKDKQACVVNLIHSTHIVWDEVKLQLNYMSIEKYPVTLNFGEKERIIVIVEKNNKLGEAITNELVRGKVIIVKPKDKDYTIFIVNKSFIKT